MTTPPWNDPQDMWQSQSPEPGTMSLNEFQARLRNLRAKSRRNNIRNLLLVSAVILLFVSILIRTEQPLAQFALGLWILGVLAIAVPIVASLWRGGQPLNPA